MSGRGETVINKSGELETWEKAIIGIVCLCLGFAWSAVGFAFLIEPPFIEMLSFWQFYVCWCVISLGALGFFILATEYELGGD